MTQGLFDEVIRVAAEEYSSEKQRNIIPNAILTSMLPPHTHTTLYKRELKGHHNDRSAATLNIWKPIPLTTCPALFLYKAIRRRTVMHISYSLKVVDEARKQFLENGAFTKYTKRSISAAKRKLVISPLESGFVWLNQWFSDSMRLKFVMGTRVSICFHLDFVWTDQCNITAAMSVYKNWLSHALTTLMCIQTFKALADLLVNPKKYVRDQWPVPS